MPAAACAPLSGVYAQRHTIRCATSCPHSAGAATSRHTTLQDSSTPLALKTRSTTPASSAMSLPHERSPCHGVAVGGFRGRCGQRTDRPDDGHRQAPARQQHQQQHAESDGQVAAQSLVVLREHHCFRNARDHPPSGAGVGREPVKPRYTVDTGGGQVALALAAHDFFRLPRRLDANKTLSRRSPHQGDVLAIRYGDQRILRYEPEQLGTELDQIDRQDQQGRHLATVVKYRVRQH